MQELKKNVEYDKIAADKFVRFEQKQLPSYY